tara:strand:- start:2374 stop:2961 length:588 start_codon:yes stop_codon:yes gene_type:complete
MAKQPSDTGDSKLQNLLGSVPDRHHTATRSIQTASINGRQPAPLHLWNPDFCGDVDMSISADGTWYHEGMPIKRAELWQLFAGILRREDDGDYFLVTPVEKCRVSVALHPLIINDFEQSVSDGEPELIAVLNAGGRFVVSDQHPLRLEPKANGAAYVTLPHGLSALCSRPAWYRLAELADATHCIESAGARFYLA